MRIDSRIRAYDVRICAYSAYLCVLCVLCVFVRICAYARVLSGIHLRICAYFVRIRYVFAYGPLHPRPQAGFQRRAIEHAGISVVERYRVEREAFAIPSGSYQ